MGTYPSQYGFVGQYDFTIKPVDLSFGYWYQVMEDSLPPPLAQKQYKINPYTLTFAGWTTLNRIENRYYNVPYMTAKTTFWNTTIMGTLKYNQQESPGVKYYKTTGIPDGNYDNVWNNNFGLKTSYGGNSWRFWEPGLSVNHAFRDDLNVYFAYGKAYGFNAWASQASAYTSNQAVFDAAGITLDSLMNSLDPEKYDNFDLGLRYKGKMFTIAPTIYYSRIKNKAVTVYDSVLKVPYISTDTDATAYGAELEVEVKPQVPWGQLSIYANGSYNYYGFNNNIQSVKSNKPYIVQSKGNQLPDTPEYMAKFAAMYSLNNFSITPLVRYIGTRYADVENTLKVESYWIADIYGSYDTGRLYGLENVILRLSVLNVLNKQYVGVINTSDFALSNSATFYPGAPLTVMGGVTIKY